MFIHNVELISYAATVLAVTTNQNVRSRCMTYGNSQLNTVLTSISASGISTISAPC